MLSVGWEERENGNCEIGNRKVRILTESAIEYERTGSVDKLLRLRARREMQCPTDDGKRVSSYLPLFKASSCSFTISYEKH